MTESFAAEKEDVLILDKCKELGFDTVDYLDIGASHPWICNNTYLLYKNGYRGVLVEPLPWNIELLKEHRPEDILVEGVVCNDDRKIANVRIYGKHGGGSRIMDCDIPDHKRHVHSKSYRVNHILQLYFNKSVPTVLNIDIEGWELRILQDFDFTNYPIPICCIEHGHHEPGVIDSFMESIKYSVDVKTKYNTIYRKQSSG